LLIDIVDSVDRERAPEEKAEADMLMKNKCSGKYRKYELYIGYKADIKWARNLHKSL
jgi:hypothetical protein